VTVGVRVGVEVAPGGDVGVRVAVGVAAGVGVEVAPGGGVGVWVAVGVAPTLVGVKETAGVDVREGVGVGAESTGSVGELFSQANTSSRATATRPASRTRARFKPLASPEMPGHVQKASRPATGRLRKRGPYADPGGSELSASTS